jgi:hypothetical protein
VRIRKIHPILTGIIHTALRTCEKIRFHSGPVCSSCGRHLSGYDEREKRFAILLEDEVACPVHVIIQRSYCRSCGKIVVPPEPFYPGTRIGSPVVDLCRSFSRTMPYSQVSTYLDRMGVVVNRWSARHYSITPLPEVPAVDLFGMQIPVSILALSALPRPGSEPLNPGMDDILHACKYPFIPFNTSIPRYGNPTTTIDREKQKKIINEFVSGVSQSMGIIFICTCIISAICSGITVCLPDGLIDVSLFDMEGVLLPAAVSM